MFHGCWSGIKLQILFTATVEAPTSSFYSQKVKGNSELITAINKIFLIVIIKVVLSISLDFYFSFGILLWSIVTGKQPYASKLSILYCIFKLNSNSLRLC